MGRVAVQTAVISAADVWIAYLDPVVGHEQGGRRPVVIISNDLLHEVPSSLVFVVPCTTRDRRVITHVPIVLETGEFPRESFAMTEQMRSISRQRLRKRVGSIDEQTLSLIRKRVLRFLDLGRASLGS